MEKMSRLSVDIPASVYRNIKAFAALNEMTVKELIMDRLQDFTPKKSKKPNKTTLQVFKDTDAGKNLSKVYTDQNEMWADI